MTVNFLRSSGWQARRARVVGASDGPMAKHSVRSIHPCRRAEPSSAAVLDFGGTTGSGHCAACATFRPRAADPSIAVTGIPREIRGSWSLWTVATRSRNLVGDRVLPLFLHDEGRNLQPTARHIWHAAGQMLSSRSTWIAPESAGFYSEVSTAAEHHGHPVYEEMIRLHQKRLERERENKHYSFDARRRGIQKIGLAPVRRAQTR